MKIRKEKLQNELQFIITIKDEVQSIFVPKEQTKIKIPFNIYAQFFDEDASYDINLKLFYKSLDSKEVKSYTVGNYLLDKNGIVEKNKNNNNLKKESDIGIIFSIYSKMRLNLNINSFEGNYELVAFFNEKILATRGFNIRKKIED